MSIADVAQFAGFLAVLIGVLFLCPVPLAVVIDGVLMLAAGVAMEVSQRGPR